MPYDARGGDHLGLRDLAPASSISAKPAVNMTMALTPRLARSSTAGAATLGGDGDDRDVRRFRQVGDRGIGLQALHLGAVRIDRIERALEALRLHIGDRPAADAGRVGRGAEHGDRTRRQQWREAGKARGCIGHGGRHSPVGCETASAASAKLPVWRGDGAP